MTCTELWSTHPDDLGALDGESLRRRFVVSDLFGEGAFSFTYAHDDRILLGGIRLTGGSAPLDAPELLAADFLLERREAALVGLEGELRVSSSAGDFVLRRHDVLYLPLGTRDIEVAGDGVLYLVSAPAHAPGEAAIATRDGVEALRLGSPEGANDRTIRKYVHADGIRSNQLVLGITTLEPGSVWNTMPAHVHSRRTEVYLYDGLEANPLVHLMGRPDDTRHLILHDRDAVVSPPWSIHSGSATGAYSFVWAMAGENVDYGDVAPVSPELLK
ncbi:5-dehydro-4-deoxy-D-glucuronate isomerase [Microbacterium hydrocarbonoxydans]|uniref:5-dehydro-4-deoxy-D-glucuronate isomerase n=1 Tax=Microbacterium hydrocarbonoxydans TaxID=273678 RepID=UPI0007BB9872|nr:5-dehydro-4-deoxy-D-glucuronate isomerase [Microbacterium hydrocarbonoxydans]GAT72983.1 4-deoxy-L-threo-5-hexosulose-uronate ketol-isomerase [Microbacterium sp. HM58-2]